MIPINTQRLVALLAFISAFVSFASCGSPRDPQQPLVASPELPNIVFILTDDQDLHLKSLDYTPLVRKHLADQGTFYRRHYVHTALCCPSRVSLWTGKVAHNTNVTDVNPPYGGYPKFVKQGFNEDYLPVWLQDAGYDVYYTGKLFNAHTVDNYDKPFVAGFTGSDFLLDPYTYQYLNATFQRNREPPVSYEGQYSTDVLAEKAYGFLDDAVSNGNPFFLAVAPNAPHTNVEFNGIWNSSEDMAKGEVKLTAPIPAERHRDLFKNVRIPRTKHFNPEVPSGVSWVRELPRQNQSNVDYNDHLYRQRLRALQAVDELVEGLVSRLDQYGLLDNTYIIYTSDNGYHIGQHRLQPGKECGFEEDINVPLFIRGPGVPKGESTNIVTSHTDLAPTILSLVGAGLQADLDGVPIPVSNADIGTASIVRHEHVGVEYWGFALGEGVHGAGFHWNNTYKSLRLIGKSYNLYYSVWCNNEHELYNLNNDPQQLDNILHSGRSYEGTTLHGLPIGKVISRLDSLLFVLKSCKGQTCTNPWLALHPQGDVRSFEDALAQRYDHFYEQEQGRVSFSRCENGFILDAEGPQFETEGLVYRDGIRWSEWV